MVMYGAAWFVLTLLWVVCTVCAFCTQMAGHRSQKIFALIEHLTYAAPMRRLMRTEAESMTTAIIYPLITVHPVALVTKGGATVSGTSDKEVF